MLDRKSPPVFNRDFSFEVLQPTTITLPNGIPIHLIKGGEQEVIKVEVIVPAGKWYEPAKGISYFTTHVLYKGTHSKSSYEIASIFDALGAHLECSPGVDFVHISLYTLSKKLRPALALLIEIIKEPSFPEKEIEQVKSIYLQNLKINYERTSFLASKTIRKNIFGTHNPYGTEVEEQDLQSLHPDVLTKFHQTFFKQAQVIVSGKINSEHLQHITDLCSELPYASTPDVLHKDFQSLPNREHVEKEGSVQNTLRIGKRCVLRSHANYPDILFLNHILGGFFGSRLMKNIREEKGFTYGIHSSIHTMKHGSYLVIGTDVNKENRDETFEEIRKEFRRLSNELISEDEIEVARNHFIGGLQSELSTTFSHADKVKNIILHNLDANFYTNLIVKIESLSADHLQHIAASFFQEDSFFEVSAG